MTDKENLAKLIEIAHEDYYEHFDPDKPYLEAVAERLLANGVTVTPVVRCKDCIHWYEREAVCLKIYSDGGVHPLAWQERKPEDFCNYGERRK